MLIFSKNNFFNFILRARYIFRPKLKDPAHQKESSLLCGVSYIDATLSVPMIR